MENETTKLETFFFNLEDILQNAKKFKKDNSMEYAFEFNPLIHFYGIGENRSSDILAFFLNPDEKHGQGNLFLTVFLSAEFGWKEKLANFKTAKIHREKQTIEQRRIDLLIDIEFEDGKKYGIGIENKIWAADQVNQLLDYNNWLKNEYQDNYTLFYLTPFGKDPDEKSIPSAEFKTLKVAQKILLIDHSSIMTTLIDLWAEKCKAERVRQFLKDFKQFINHSINGSIFMTDQNTIADYILKSEPRLETALAVSQSMNEVYNRLISNLEEPLKKIALENQLKLEFNLKRGKNLSGFSFQTSEKHRFNIGFEWYSGNIQNGIYGFIYKENQDTVSEIDRNLNRDLTDKITKVLGKFLNSTAWPWYKPLKEYKDFNDRTYLDINNEKFLLFIDGKLKELLKAVEV